MSLDKTTETDLLYAILDYLDLCGIKAWRQNTGGMTKTNAEGEERYIPFGIPGQSDIIGILPGSGRMLAIEVKMPGNTPTPDQWEYLLMVQRSGGVGFWVDSLAQVQRALPHIQNGCWIATDFNYRQEVTDEWTTSAALLPPKAKRKGAKRGARTGS